MTLPVLIFRYAGFAVIAIVGNLGVQRLILTQGHDATTFMVALGAGTVTGLVIKYILDRKWIFYDQSAGMKAHGRQFSLYTAMGLITTAIFWVVETAFWLTWQTDVMREIGAILGLSIGYVIKYKLDSRFVFSAHRKEGAA